MFWLVERDRWYTYGIGWVQLYNIVQSHTGGAGFNIEVYTQAYYITWLHRYTEVGYDAAIPTNTLDILGTKEYSAIAR